MGDQPPVHGHDMVPEANVAHAAPEIDGDDGEEGDEDAGDTPGQAAAPGSEEEANRRRRRRGRRGGRRRRHGDRDGSPGNGADRAREPHQRDGEHGSNLESSPAFVAEQHDAFDANRPMAASEPATASYTARDSDPEPHRHDERHHDVAPPAAPRHDTPRHETPAEQPSAVLAEPVAPKPHVEEEPTQSGPPRRGWWQRLTTRE